MTPEHITYGLWVAWVASWTVARLLSNRTEKRGSVAFEILFRGFAGLGAILVFAFPSNRGGDAQMQLWLLGDAAKWILAVLTACGLLFTWWARVHLGRLWSDWVTKKAGHHVVD